MDKPVGTKPVSDEKFAPAAIPVATPEKAERINARAIAAKDNLSVIEGVIAERSLLPDPGKSDYPDCRFTAKFEGEAIVAGTSCPKTIQLVIDGFEDYHVLDANLLEAGKSYRIEVIPFEMLSIDDQSTQQADDLNLFDNIPYYMLSAKAIETYTDIASTTSNPIQFENDVQEYISIYKRMINSIPPDEKQMEAQQTEIRNSLREINEILASYNNDRKAQLNERFAEVWNDETKKDPPNYNRVKGLVWRDIDNSFWWLEPGHAFIRDYNPIQQKNIDALIHFQDFLNSQGIQFMISLVPSGSDIAARVINPEFRYIPDFQTLQTAKQLLEHGIETIYPSKEIVENYNRYQFGYFFPLDGHASETVQDVCAEIVAKRLNRFHFEKNIDSELISIKPAPHRDPSNEEFLWPENADIGNNKPHTEFMVRTVFYDGEDMNKRDTASPILILGNSFIWNPCRTDAFPAYLFSHIQHTVDWYRINTHGPFTSMITNIFHKPEKFLSGKKVVIMHVNAGGLHANINFTDIRDLDNSSLLLSGRQLVSKEHCAVPQKLDNLTRCKTALY